MRHLQAGSIWCLLLLKSAKKNLVVQALLVFLTLTSHFASQKCPHLGVLRKMDLMALSQAGEAVIPRTLMGDLGPARSTEPSLHTTCEAPELDASHLHERRFPFR
jgi:hypothetical protein